MARDESEGRIKEMMGKIGEWFGDQQWFQELRSKWDELDPEKQLWVKAGFLGGVAFLMLGLVGSSFLAVSAMKSDVTQKSSLVSTIRGANDELKRLKEASGAGASAIDATPWSSYFENVLSSSNIDPSAFELSTEKPGAKTEQSTEALFDIKLKHVTIKQIVRFANAIEAGPRPVKLKTLEVDTKNDPTGYMDAKLSISAFKLASQ